MRKFRLFVAVFGAALIVIISCFRLFRGNAPRPTTTIVGRAGEQITESIPVPGKKYPYGFPIEVLQYKESVTQGRRFFSARCVWHPEADSILGGKPAVVPVTIVRLDERTKTITSLLTIVSQPDGFFTALIPDTARDAKYSLALRVQFAKDCPYRFKKRSGKQLQTEKLKTI